MSIEVLGISGSPTKNSNTDRLVQEIIRSSGLESEFIKLSNVDVKPCFACKGCVKDNTCIVKDDFVEISEKVKQAKVIIIGGYTPYGGLDARSKAFLERLWSMRHRENLLKGKYFITVITGVSPNAIKQAENMILMEVVAEKAIMLKQLRVQGSVPCLSCGYGHKCDVSNIPPLYGNKQAATTKNCLPVEKQSSWKKANDTGIMVRKLIRQEITFNQFKYKLKMVKFMIPMMVLIMNARRWVRKGLDKIALRK